MGSKHSSQFESKESQAGDMYLASKMSRNQILSKKGTDQGSSKPSGPVITSQQGVLNGNMITQLESLRNDTSQSINFGNSKAAFNSTLNGNSGANMMPVAQLPA